MRKRKLIIAKIKETLDSVDSVKAVYVGPITKITTFPAVIFMDSKSDNTFETNQENFKILKYKAYLVISATQKERSEIFEDVLPNALDDIEDAFDRDWNGGTINGHRVWIRLESGDPSIKIVQSGIEVTSEMELVVKMMTSN